MCSNDAAKSHAGITAVGLFLLFGSLMALLAGITLPWKGSALDRVWRLNPHAYRHLAPLGKFVGIPFLVLSALLALTAVGWFERRYWGWLLAVAVIATQVLGDAANLFLGRFLEGLIGFSSPAPSSYLQEEWDLTVPNTGIILVAAPCRPQRTSAGTILRAEVNHGRYT